jgi:LysM repeat protein
MTAAAGSPAELDRAGRRRRRAVVALGLVAATLVPSILERALAAPVHVVPRAAPAAPPTTTYTVRRGDYLYGIARTTGTDFATLLALNGLSAGSLILPGQVLTVMAVTGSGSDADAELGPDPAGATYTVRRGDYLYGIARATGTDFSTLLTLNGISARSLILPGQVLRVAGAGSDAGATATPSWSGATYTVRRGDYLYGIARTTGTELAVLLRWNALSLGSVIRPGQVLRVGRSGDGGSAATYTVVSGDCWSCIARRVGVTTRALLGANGATASTTIHPGDVIRLPAGATMVDPAPPVEPSRPAPVVDPWLTERLVSVVGRSRLSLAESLGARRVGIVWDESVPFGTEAITEPSLTIRVHPRLRSREGRLDNVLAHEFGHVMALAAMTSGAIADPAACHEKVADEIATRLRGSLVRAHPTASCTWDEARLIADAVFALGY